MLKTPMIEIGKWNKRLVIRKEPHGFYLQGDEEWDNILLPNKNAPEALEIGDEVDAFIYFDSEEVIIATTQKPIACVGEFGVMRVAQNVEFGSFLEWGLDKQLFVPFREQVFKLEEGKSYAFYVYIDSSGRISASTRISKNTEKPDGNLVEGQVVDLIAFQKTEMGIKAIINSRYEGLIFREEPINDIKLGDSFKGYIKKIRTDEKIDLSLSEIRELFSFTDLEQQIIDALKEAGGSLSICSKSSAEEVNSMFGVSRNKFKSALGSLYKQRVVNTDNERTSLIDEEN